MKFGDIRLTCVLCGQVMKDGDQHGIDLPDKTIGCRVQMIVSYPSKMVRISSVD